VENGATKTLSAVSRCQFQISGELLDRYQCAHTGRAHPSFKELAGSDRGCSNLCKLSVSSVLNPKKSRGGPTIAPRERQSD